MPITVEFLEQLRGPWETASGFLCDQMEIQQAQLAAVFPLIEGIQSDVSALESNDFSATTGYSVSSILTTDSAGTPGFTSVLPAPIAFSGARILSPPDLTVNTDDWSPTGLSAAAIIRIAATGAVNLTGMAAALTAQFKLLINVGTNTITVKNLTTSLAVNQFRCPGNADFSLTRGTATWLWYDRTSSLWQVI